MRPGTLLPAAILAMAAAALAQPPQLSYAPPANYPVGAAPNGIVTADFNGDGLPDLVVVNGNSNSFSYLQALNGGTFQPAVTFSMAGSTSVAPTLAAAGDFNGDGHADVAVLHNGSPGIVTVHLGDGQGTFAIPGAIFPTVSFPTSIVAGDFNSDGKPDLAIGSCQSQSIAVHSGAGDGTFNNLLTQFFVSSCSSGTLALVSADFNKDQKADLAAAISSANAVKVYLATGSGTFNAGASLTVPGGPGAITICDFNNDGNIDIATANLAGNNASVFLGNGTGGTFTNPANVAVGAAPTDIATVDFTNNFHADLLTANSGANTMSALFGDGTGQFPDRLDLGTGATPLHLASADFNSDGVPDIAVTNSGSNNVSVLLSAGACTIGLIPLEQVFGHNGGSASVTVLVSGGCTISAASNQPWVTVNSISQSAVNYTVAANSTANLRTAAVNISGYAFSLVQTPSPGGQLDTESLVYELYGDVLGRPPDSGGLSYYRNALDTAALSPEQVGTQFLNSAEFASAGGFMVELYPVLLARTADFGGWLFFSSEILNGFASQTSVIDTFFATAEFTSKYGNPAPTQFVTLLYNNALGRAPDSGGLNFYINELNTGTTRAQVVQQFLGSTEFRQHLGNRIFVDALYMTLLRRTPDAGGESYWTGLLDNSSGTQTQVVRAFLGSAEYLGRF